MKLRIVHKHKKKIIKRNVIKDDHPFSYPYCDEKKEEINSSLYFSHN